MIKKMFAERIPLVQKEIVNLEKISKLSERHVSLQKLEAIIIPLTMMAIKKTDVSLTDLIYKLVRTHVGFSKQTLSAHFVEQTHRLIDQLINHKEAFGQFLLLYKIFSGLYSRILDKKELNFLAKMAVEKMKSAPPEFKIKHAELMRQMEDDLESSTQDLQIDLLPDDNRPLTTEELEMSSVMGDMMDTLLDLQNYLENEGILLPQDYSNLKLMLEREINQLQQPTPQ